MIKKINLRGISEILSEKELKNVMGGSGSCQIDKGPCGLPCSIFDNGKFYAGTCTSGTFNGGYICACVQN